MIENFRVRQGNYSDLFDLEGNIKPEVVLELGCWYLCIGDKNLSLYVCIKEADELVLRPLSDDSVKKYLDELADKVATHEALLGINEGNFETALLINCNDLDTSNLEANAVPAKIINKNASLSDWLSSRYNLPAEDENSLRLEKGELALAYVEVAKTDSEGNLKMEPSYLAKAGDGEHTFSELAWINAPASDVYPWAKSENISIKDNNLVFSKGAPDGSDLVLCLTDSYYTKADIENLFMREPTEETVLVFNGGSAKDYINTDEDPID